MVSNFNIAKSSDKDILERFSKLSSACHKYPTLYLQGLKPAVGDSFDVKEFVEKYSPDGFVEKFCLNVETAEKVRVYRLENVNK